MTFNGAWLAVCMTAFIAGVLVGALLFKGRGGAKAEAPQSASRMLGLALLGQGQLDMALDCFLRAPQSPALMDNLYQLALEFERKRQFDKAQGVYQRLLQRDKRYKDAQSRLERAAQLAQSVILDGDPRLLDAAPASLEHPTLGRYRLEKELGQGAMGVIYLASDPVLQRRAAIKTMALSRDFAGDTLQEARKRFFREAEAAARLSHSNIVAVYEAGEERGLAYIAMEFVVGKNLSQYADPTRLLPLSHVLDIAIQVAKALHYAHSEGVVHRDIKPANIMYAPGQSGIKITDFGVAHIVEAQHTRSGLMLGTPSFMSPEQVSGQPVDGRSDLYSLGVCLYQLLTGALPIHADSMAELVYAITHRAAPDVRELRPELPQALAQLVAKALQKQPSLRYQNGEEMVQDLVQVRRSLEGADTVLIQNPATGDHAA